MSQGAVERALGKLVTDDAFRDRFFVEPALASLTAGLALSPVELEALSHLSPQALARFSRRLDARIRRLPVAAAEPVAPDGERHAADDRPLAESYTKEGARAGGAAPEGGDDMASRDALTQAGRGSDLAEDPDGAGPAVKMIVHA